MYILEPIFDYRLWGGSRLSGIYGNKAKGLAHLYSVYGKSDNSNTILNGKFAGQSLFTVFNRLKDKWKMSCYDQFPLTIAIVDANDNLSIQVHPNDEIAMSIEGLLGKRESWYFILPPSQGYIYNGMSLDAAEDIEHVIRENRIMDVIDKIEISAGDYIFVEPGTIHAMTVGSLVYEIEEGSDLTYRLYDYDRIDERGNKRDLHIEKGILSVDIKLKTKPIQYNGDNWIQEKTYATRVLENMTSYENNSDTFECLTLIDVAVVIDGINVKNGMTILLEPQEVIKDVFIKNCIVARLL